MVPGIRHVLAQLSSSLDSLEAGVEATWDGLVEPLERMTDQLSRTWGIVSHLKVPGPWRHQYQRLSRHSWLLLLLLGYFGSLFLLDLGPFLNSAFNHRRLH